MLISILQLCVCVSCGGAVHAPTCPSIIQQPTVLDASPWFNAGHDGQDASFPLIDTEVVSCSACSRFTFDCETVCSGKVTVFFFCFGIRNKHSSVSYADCYLVCGHVSELPRISLRALSRARSRALPCIVCEIVNGII